MKTYAVIAHDVSPNMGSEAGNAWYYINQLEINKINCTIFVAENNQLNTENYKEQINNYNIEFKHVNFQFVPYSNIIRIFIKILKIFLNSKNPIGSRFTYGFFYKLWLTKVNKLINNKNYEVVHLFNHISFRWPLQNFKEGSVYLWGPVSGIEDINLNFLDNKKFINFRKIKYKILISYKNFILKKNKNIKKFALKCDAVFAVTKQDLKYFKDFNSNTLQQLDVFYKNINQFQIIKNYSNKLKLNIMFVGRIDDLKGLDIAINSIKYEKNVQLNIFGSGPLEKFYKEYCFNNGINNVKFYGNIEKVKLYDEYQNNHLLLHTSIKEAGCSAVIEAMEFGLPVIAHNAFGMSVSLNDEVGWLIPYNNSADSTTFINNIIKDIFSNESLIYNKSKKSLEHVKLFTINSYVEKIKFFLEIN